MLQYQAVLAATVTRIGLLAGQGRPPATDPGAHELSCLRQDCQRNCNCVNCACIGRPSFESSLIYCWIQKMHSIDKHWNNVEVWFRQLTFWLRLNEHLICNANELTQRWCANVCLILPTKRLVNLHILNVHSTPVTKRRRWSVGCVVGQFNSNTSRQQT